MIKMKIASGQTIILDEDVFEKVKDKKVYYNLEKLREAYFYEKKEKGYKKCYLRNIILPPKKGHYISFKTNDKHDLRRENLFYETTYDSCIKKKKDHNSKSKYKGLAYRKDIKGWQVNVFDKGSQYYVGLFYNEREAAIAYDDFIYKLRGNKAKLNFPERYSS